MPIVETKKEDILTFPMQTIVIPVNTVGAMGAGLARVFKDRYPQYFVKYFEDCRAKRLKIGRSIVYPIYPIGKREQHQVLFFPTKQYWGHDSELVYIEKGLIDFKNRFGQMSVKSIAFPLIGCGKGNLDTASVLELMHTHLDPLPIPVKICLRHY